MTHEELRKNHFARLNNYRHSAEYAEYAKLIGAPVPEGDLPCLLGHRWEIDKEIYDEFLGMLPPVNWRRGAFFLSEFTFDDITTRYSMDGDKYYCEFARFPERPKPVVNTPWGVAQHSREYAPGIVFYSTASHGGFHLSDARVAMMPKCLREFVPFGGEQRGAGRWLEEDCDWSIVAIAFPQFFKPEDIEVALSTIKHYKPELFAELVKDIDLPTGGWQRKLTEAARASAKRVAGLGA
jgi:hypothetical protein